MSIVKRFFRRAWNHLVRVMSPHSPAAMAQRGGTDWYNPVTKRYEPDPDTRRVTAAKVAKSRSKNKAARKARSNGRKRK